MPETKKRKVEEAREWTHAPCDVLERHFDGFRGRGSRKDSSEILCKDD